MPRKYVRKTDRSGYDSEKLRDAVKAVKNGTLSAYAASKLHNIPRTTIVNRVYDRKGLKSKTLGRCTALPMDVEVTLAKNLHIMEKSGFGLTRKEVIELVGQYVGENKIKTPFKDGVPGEDWFISFKNRHGLSVKKPQAVEHARKNACRPAVIYNYFDLLENTLDQLGLQDKPSHIYNCDETSFSKDPSKSNIVGRRGYTATRTIASPGKTNTTVLLACNAAGEKAPPLIIYTGKNIWNEWVSEDGFPGTVYAATEKGWMEAKVFENFFEKVFLPTVGNKRPILLLYDGHATHVGINIIRKARENNITILKIPPHTSHLLQPLDLAVNKSFKDKWDVELVKWQRLNVGKVLSKKEFSTIIGKVWTQLDSQVCKAGFRKAGICPLNKNVIPEEKFDPDQLKEWKSKKLLEKSQNQIINKTSPKTLSEIVLTVVNKIYVIQQDVPQHNSIQAPVSLADVLHSKEKSAPSLSIENVQQGPKFQILSNERVFTNVKSFEELILKMIKPGKPSSTAKRTKIAPGAEVITHDHVYERYQKIEAEKEEKLKKQEEKKANKEKKKETKGTKRNKMTGAEKKHGEERRENGINYKQPDKHVSDVDISLPGPSGLNKNIIIKNDFSKKKILKRKNLRRISSPSSTSVSDCMSMHSDSDIVDLTDDEYDVTGDLCIYKNRATEMNKAIQEVSRKSDERNDLGEKVFDRSDETNQTTEEVCVITGKGNNNTMTKMTKGGVRKCDERKNKEEKESYQIKDNVLIRYYNRKKWMYYVGYINNILSESDISYDINFYKTYKKPLRFKLSKIVDRDTVLEYSIVKKVLLSQNPNNSKEFFLDEEDHSYFS